MVAEKGVAFAEAATTLATGGSMKRRPPRPLPREQEQAALVAFVPKPINGGLFEGRRPKPTVTHTRGTSLPHLCVIRCFAQ